MVVSAACDDSEPLLFLVASSAQLQSISLPDPRGFLPTKFGPETLINRADSSAPALPGGRAPDAKFRPGVLQGLMAGWQAWARAGTTISLTPGWSRAAL